MTLSSKLLAGAGFIALAGCSFSVGSPRTERVAEAMQEAMEGRGMEVLSITFEEDENDRDIYHGDVTVRFEGSDEEVESSCDVVIDDEQTIESSDCPGLEGHLRSVRLEEVITAFYTGRGAEVSNIDMDWVEGMQFAGSADIMDPRTGRQIRVNCQSPAINTPNADWECSE
jgi:hypothetical protein